MLAQQVLAHARPRPPSGTGGLMPLLTPDSLDPIRNDASACVGVHHVASFAQRSGAVAALAARGAGRDHALADVDRGAAAQPLRPPFGTSRRRSPATRGRGHRAVARRTGGETRGGSASRGAASKATEAQSRFIARASAAGGGVVDIADKTCGCCGAPLHTIGEDRSEMLDYVPAQIRVQVIRRPRYGCRACEGAVVQAPAPERPIDGGLATEALLAHVLVNKYADHLPLYRQSQIFARQGVELDRSTLCNWVGRACWWLEPLYELMLSTVLSSPKVVADDTTLPVLGSWPRAYQDRTAVVLCRRQPSVVRTRSSCGRVCLQ